MNDYDHGTAFAYYTTHQQRLRDLVSGVLLGRRTYRVDEIMSDVVLHRLPSLLARWSEEKGQLDAYVNSSLRWYVFKHLTRVEDRRNRREIGIDDLSGSRDHSPETTDQTAERLDDLARCAMLESRLSPEQLRVLRRRFVDGMEVQAICDAMRIGKTTFYVRLNEALHAARRALG